MKNWDIRDLMDILDAPDLEIREDGGASCDRIKEAVMNKITAKKTLRRSFGIAAACAAVLALTVMVMAGTGAFSGFSLLDDMTKAEEAQFREYYSMGRMDSSVSKDGTVRYYDIGGNVIFEGTGEEAAEYEAQRAQSHQAELEAATELVDFRGMTLIPSSVSEVAVSGDGEIPDFLITNGHLAVFMQEDGSGWELKKGTEAAIRFTAEEPCHAVFYLIGDGGQVLEEALDLGRMAEPQWEVEIPADGVYRFAVLYTSSDPNAFTEGSITFR